MRARAIRWTLIALGALAVTGRLPVEQRFTGVDTAAMLGQLLDQKRLGGRGALTAQTSSAGADRRTLLANLSGPFEMRVTDGRFAGVDLWAEIEGAVAQARGAAPSRPVGPKVRPAIGRVLEASARRQLQKEGEQVEQKLRQKLEDKLRDLLRQ